MGLDMYLYARKYVSRNDYKRENGEIVNVENEQFTEIAKHFPPFLTKYADDFGLYVQLPVAYWRKANQIHGWFVEEIQDGEDDCGEYYVSFEKLQELLDLVEKVLMYRTEEKALEDLPPTQGFFFGSYEVDDWYWEQLQYTHDTLKHIIENADGYSIFYSSSW